MKTAPHSSSFKKRFSNIAMNVIAVAFTIMPIVTVGLWTHTMFFNDSRKVSALAQVSAPEAAPFREPLVSVTFDDGWEAVYTDAASLLAEYDIASTQYVLTGVEKDPQYLSYKQIESLKNAGHEIALHGMDHENLPTLDTKDLERELGDSKRELMKRNLVNGRVHFASPFSAYDARTIAAIKQHYSAHRNTNADLSNVDVDDVNMPGKLDRYNIVGYSVTVQTTDEQLKTALNFAKAHNAWFVLVYHNIGDSGEKYTVTRDTFERHLKIVKASGIKTTTVGEVLKNVRQEDMQ